METELARELVEGEIVGVDGIERVVVPMVAVGYRDDMILIPGPSAMNGAEMRQHLEEERAYNEWIQVHPDRFPDNDDEWSEAEGESDSGVDIELGDIHDVEE